MSQPVDEGVANWVRVVAGDQVERDWDVVVASPLGGALRDGVVTAGARHVPWEAARAPGRSMLQEATTLRALVARVRPDLVHLHSSKAGMVGRTVLRGRVPTLFQPHAWSFLAGSGPLNAAALRWERLAGRWADITVCTSEQERALGIGSGLDPGRLVVVPNAVDTEAWPLASSAERAAARGELGVPSGAPMVVVVARLAVQKGQDLLLSAWPRVQAAVPQARLYLVGDGPERERLAAAAAQLPGVTLVPVRQDRAGVRRWLAAADVVVSPSRWEGMALAALETCATGRSLVTTSACGMREVVGEGPAAAGVVVPLEEPSLLPHRIADAVAARLLDPGLAAAEGAAGRRRMEERFSLAGSLESLADLSARIAGRDRGAQLRPQPDAV
ncbi:glycosyltransferase [Motilibacter aurantiacus]|uniref:glycosyltransferase n=1 Tax=Motilibacter aurantiacus TaxID=2714955 RepID=UPI00140CF1E3|nr:glycosyltransferase family 4 protein [Motilibacter aurantiacus]